MTLTRGEWNSNPLNINYMKPSVAWRGQIGIETVQPGHSYAPRFGRYDNDFNGIRASAKQLVKDNSVHGLKTISALIGDVEYGWAPAADRNDVAAYAATVCATLSKTLGRPIKPADAVNLTQLDQLVAIWPGFCLEENGRCTYAPALILSACQDALGLPHGVTS